MSTSAEESSSSPTPGTSSTSDTTSGETMFGKLTDSIKSKFQSWKLNAAWKHLPNALQEKIGNPENLTTMFPFTCTPPNDDSDDDDGEVQMKVSVEGELNSITFIFDPLDSDGRVAKGGNMHISFKNKQWFCMAMFDERGNDYVDMGDSPLFGKMSDENIVMKTTESVESIVKLLDLRAEAEN